MATKQPTSVYNIIIIPIYNIVLTKNNNIFFVFGPNIFFFYVMSEYQLKHV